MKTTFNYLETLPQRTINYKLTAVEAIVLTTALMVAAAIVVYMINPTTFAQ